MAQASSFSTSHAACLARKSESDGLPVNTGHQGKGLAPHMWIYGSSILASELPQRAESAKKMEAGRANVPPPITSEKDSPMTTKPLPPADVLRQLLRYEPETGKLFWRERPLSLFKSRRACNAWNARNAGKEAFTGDCGQGYRRGEIFTQGYAAHRVIWVIVHGKEPEGLIDHINCKRSDNRLCNLREATLCENARNALLRADNTSGYKGVSWHRHCRRWCAQISVNGRNRCLGYFETREEAALAYRRASVELHRQFGRPA